MQRLFFLVLFFSALNACAQNTNTNVTNTNSGKANTIIITANDSVVKSIPKVDEDMELEEISVKKKAAGRENWPNCRLQLGVRR